MKFVMSINSRKVLLTSEQLEQLAALLGNVETMEDKWVGSGKGTTGSGDSYIPVIYPYNPLEHLNLSLVSDEQVEAIKFVQKQQEK